MNLSIRTIGKILSAVFATIFIVFIYFVNELYEEVSYSKKFKRENYEMILKAQALRTSSNQLTRFVRAYAATRDKTHRDNYFKVLQIRNGEIDKPVGYENVYWSLREPLRSQRHPKSGKKSALHDELEAFNFTKEQFKNLNDALNLSNHLTKLELEAIHATDEGKTKLAQKLLYSLDYYAQKEQIMLPIDKFLESILKTYNTKRSIIDVKIDSLFQVITVLGVAELGVFIISLILFRKKVLIPLSYLTNTIEKIKHGEKNIEKIIYSDDEIGLFTEQIFDMKAQIDKDMMKLKELSSIDSLTGIKNRRSFFEASENHFKLAKRKDLALCVIMLDIDFFKKVNDTYGHVVGDEILKFLVINVKKSLRKSDIFARYGGEEFIILLPDTTLEGGIKTAEKIRKRIESTTYKKDVEVNITISLGIAELKHEKTLTELIQKADEALYKAKKGGRNMVVEAD
jgi:diguanylate cyclase (GGDEF)-like protein